MKQEMLTYCVFSSGQCEYCNILTFYMDGYIKNTKDQPHLLWMVMGPGENLVEGLDFEDDKMQTVHKKILISVSPFMVQLIIYAIYSLLVPESIDHIGQ